MKKIITMTMLPLLLAACSNSAIETTQISSEDLQHHNWTLIEIDGELLTTPDKMQAPNLEISEKMMANGNAGCNNFFGQSELKENKFRIEKMGMTMKMCREDAMATENILTKSLSQWNDMTLTEENLILTNENHTLKFELSDWK